MLRHRPAASKGVDRGYPSHCNCSYPFRNCGLGYGGPDSRRNCNTRVDRRRKGFPPGRRRSAPAALEGLQWLRVCARSFAIQNTPRRKHTPEDNPGTSDAVALALTRGTLPANMQGMAHSFLIFDFGGNEEAAQQARHRIDGWKQGFRLDKKLQVKFERKEQEGEPDSAPEPESKTRKAGSKGKTKPGAKSKSAVESAAESGSSTANPGQIRLIVRLDFSDHEKLSHQRWIERIPTEEPFKGANPRLVRAGQPEFKVTSDLFDSLD